MTHITNFSPGFASALPRTFELLKSSNLVIHPTVSGVVLHGSRGLAGGARPTSDLDLSLIVHPLPTSISTDLDSFLRHVLETTRSHWHSVIELDLAIVYDTRGCGLKCFDQTTWDPQMCSIGGVDCFGLYKVGRGFNGFVTNANVQVKWMYPCCKIWQRT